jgi:adenosylcobyric acid synthase
MKVIFLGISSGAGKTVLTAMYCRYLYKKGIKVAPFKASNLSLNSFATKDGSEIGTGQAFQALVSGVEPIRDMNPILLKPLGKGVVQLKINGVVQEDLSKSDPIDTKEIIKKAGEAFDNISKKFDAVVCEGSGSPVELNLIERDIANIGMMRARKIPAILVGDIERGGVFAALYGTWLLMPEDIRPLLKGFIINRFRGDPSILGDAIERIEELTGMEYIGTIPFVDLKFPEEDSLSDAAGGLEGTAAIREFISNIDSLLATAEKSGLDLKKIDKISSA